ncbi:hypothetical protein M231_06121 [Tremella mesenterica]|uniref:Uncharacterized protein n=1 Tax=Tremella mesenterica TaxID=5217 RepID=A0A4V1M3E4_TREME|nr:hypothetical protein M231_06121 [Tremella mesenterica]
MHPAASRLLGCDPHGLHHACFLCATDPDVSEWCPYTTPWFRQTYYDGPPTSQEGSDHDTELDLGNDQEETDAEERVWDWIDKVSEGNKTPQHLPNDTNEQPASTSQLTHTDNGSKRQSADRYEEYEC